MGHGAQFVEVDLVEQLGYAFVHQAHRLLGRARSEQGAVRGVRLQAFGLLKAFGLRKERAVRGRVGRGSDSSACLLMYKAPLGQLARERLKVMRETSDGFRIAERDLELRGPGEVLGTRQTGAASFRIADLVRDGVWVEKALTAADDVLAYHPREAATLIERWAGGRGGYAGV